LGRAGHAVPSQVLLDFQLAHAEARDAVRFSWNIDAFAELVRGLGEEVLILDTPIGSRDEYLRRPDLGRILTEGSRTRLRDSNADEADVALIVTNGLSSTAVERPGLKCRRQSRHLPDLCAETGQHRRGSELHLQHLTTGRFELRGRRCKIALPD